MADDTGSFFPLAREITTPAKFPNAPVLYARTGAQGGTILYADPARTRWVMVVFRALAEGEVVEGNGLRFHPITWAKAAQAA